MHINQNEIRRKDKNHESRTTVIKTNNQGTHKTITINNNQNENRKLSTTTTTKTITNTGRTGGAA